MCGIYKITCLANQLTYIGQSVDIKQRWCRERTNAFNPGSPEFNRALMVAFRDYATCPKDVLNYFSFEIVEECPRNELNDREEYWANFYHSYIWENGYNVARCGSGSGHYNKINEYIFYDIVKLLRETNLSQGAIGEIYSISLKTVNMINTGNQNRHDDIEYPIRKTTNTRYCKVCGKKLYSTSKTDFCKNFLCRFPLPNYKEFIDMIFYSGKQKACQFYGYSIKVINRWLQEYCLPVEKTEFKKWYEKEILQYPAKKNKLIDKYDLTGKYLATYNNGIEAGASIGRGKRQYNHIYDCISGKIPQAYGYIWKSRYEDVPISYQLN